MNVHDYGLLPCPPELDERAYENLRQGLLGSNFAYVFVKSDTKAYRILRAQYGEDRVFLNGGSGGWEGIVVTRPGIRASPGARPLDQGHWQLKSDGSISCTYGSHVRGEAKCPYKNNLL